MGKVSKGARGIHGDTPVTSQTEADLSCPTYNYVQGLYLNLTQVLTAGGTPAKGGGNPQTLSFPTGEMPPLQVTLQPGPNVELS